MKNLMPVFILIFVACGKITYVPGIPGPQGLIGKAGPIGATGATGPATPPCSVAEVLANNAAPNGGSLISCPDGSQSLVLNGTNGTDGHDGASGTLVTSVQFCPGVGHYPDTFPEVGFCINHNIYAVYSANGGFLTEVLPGHWSSDGIGSTCSFTVGADCQVTQ